MKSLLQRKESKMWTRFMDMHSGGGQKLDWAYIFIEAPENEAMLIFQNMFDRNPNRVTCTCCGDDYSTGEHETLEQATAYDRGCAYVYVDPDGKEVPESEAFISGKGLVNGCKGMYAERACTKYSFSKGYMSLPEYLEKGGKKVVYAGTIRPEHRKGELHEEGYVWR